MTGWRAAPGAALLLTAALAITACAFRAGYDDRASGLCAVADDCADGETCRADLCVPAVDAGAVVDAAALDDGPLDADPLAVDAAPLALDAAPLALDAAPLALDAQAIDAVTGASERDGGGWPGCPPWCGGGGGGGGGFP